MSTRSTATKKRRLRASEGNDGADSSTTDEPNQARSRKKVRWESASPSAMDEEAVHFDDSGDEESDSTREDKICLAISCRSGRIGCAYYDPVSGTLYILEDTSDSAHFDLMKMIIEQAHPDVVLTSSRADDDFVELLRETVEAYSGAFTIRPHKDFLPNKGRERLLGLRILSEFADDDAPEDARSSVSGDPRNAYDFMTRRHEAKGDPTMQRWSAGVRLANFTDPATFQLCMGSIAAVLDYLTREKAVGDLEDEGIGGLPVRAIESLALDQVMQINADALFSLQIFENESHASVHSEKTKEGLSLFGILNNTQTSLGRSLLRLWLLRPSMSLEVINARHDAVACFVRPENMTTADAMHTHLKGIKNVPRYLAAMRAGRARVVEWQGLIKFTYHATMLHDTISELSGGHSIPIIGELAQVLDIETFRQVFSAVNQTIDWEESSEAKRICIRSGIDEELDNLKHIYHGIDSVLSRVAEQVYSTIPRGYAESLNVVYFPQLGFLICVPMPEDWKDGNIDVLDGWSFQFSSDSHVYFKSPEMRDMDTHIGDLQPSIVDREIEIAQRLLEQILVYDRTIGRACDVLAELDCLLSFAEASRAFDYRRPQMTESNVIHITQGRHPMQERVVDIFVPNDALLVGGMGLGAPDALYEEYEDVPENRSSVLICTGANACGKSVYLKQVALIQYMAQIGCFVPAEHATLGIVDKIFTRVQTRESVSKVQSAFMIDLSQVSLALRNCTSRSLILLDEFGKGTISTDGAGLLCGVVTYLLRRGVDCPKVLAATHFHEIFNSELLNIHSLPITASHMQVLISPQDADMAEPHADLEEQDDFGVPPGQKITYLYRVANGLSLESHAAICAELFGVPRRIIARAQYVSGLLSTYSLGQLLDEEMKEAERQDLEQAEAVCRRFLSWDLADHTDVNRSVKETLAEVLRRGMAM